MPYNYRHQSENIFMNMIKYITSESNKNTYRHKFCWNLRVRLLLNLHNKVGGTEQSTISIWVEFKDYI